MQRPRPAQLYALKFKGSAIDRHFIVTIARRFGISQSEFLRRILHDVRLEYLKRDLYTLPACQGTAETPERRTEG